MRIETIKKEGWEISRFDDGRFLLVYERNIIDENGGGIEINAEIYNEAKTTNINLPELFTKYKLKDCKKIFSIIKGETYPPPVNTSNKYYGQAYIVTHEGDKYYFEYLLAYHGGGIRKFEITKEIFEYAQNDKLTITDILDKFNLHHLDVPENDVK
ncbi:MAG TPA: hypothetical protein VHO46_11570 [Bacteroidales bacterium]|nr:hypothetical protein [Bacteroidales bacterium]